MISKLARLKRHFGDELHALIAAARQVEECLTETPNGGTEGHRTAARKLQRPLIQARPPRPEMVIPRVPSAENDAVVIDRHPKPLMPTLQVEA
jgi:hypothetical protein